MSSKSEIKELKESNKALIDRINNLEELYNKLYQETHPQVMGGRKG